MLVAHNYNESRFNCAKVRGLWTIVREKAQFDEKNDKSLVLHDFQEAYVGT